MDNLTASKWRKISLVILLLTLIALTHTRDVQLDDHNTATTPNILIIVTDDQRNGLHLMDDTMRWFGQGGVQYLNAYATTPRCCPSRASILTGRYVHNHDVTTEGRAQALDQETTINYYLDRAGYHTALFGKYLNTWPLRRTPPYWDEFAFFRNSTANTYNGVEWNIDGALEDTGKYAPHYIGDRAEAAIRDATRPWLLYLATPNPHGPSITEPEYATADVGPFESNPAVEETDLSDKPLYVQNSDKTLTPKAAARTRMKHLRSLFAVDDLVQRVFEALTATGQIRNTLAIFISDNAFLWGEHRLCCKSVQGVHGREG